MFFRGALLLLLVLASLSGCLAELDGVEVSATPKETATVEQTPVADSSETPIHEQSIIATPPNSEDRIESGADFEFDVAKVERQISARINGHREIEGKETLVSDERLERIGRYHSFSMVKRDYYSHVDPLIGGPTRRMTNLGYECPNMYGETIHAVPYNVTLDMYNDTYDLSIEEEISRFIVDAWMNSPPHRNELLQEEYDVVGVGIFVSKDARILVTAEFCG